VQAHHALLFACLDAHEAHARRDAASQIAAASVASFLPPLPSMRYGLTKFAAISRASSPIARSLRAQWCALEHASIAIRQPAGN
jgi:hypothetical protein